jgi:hypothetical protein
MEYMQFAGEDVIIFMEASSVKWLKVSANKRFLETEDGTSFFWLGDTAWELFHRLTREEAELYLQTRAEQKFNVIQAVALAEFEGLTVPNAYGRFPLLKNSRGEYDPTLPDLSSDGYDYWDHVDYIVDLAASLGLYVAMLPAWGDKFNQAWGKGPVVFNGDNARTYGRWLGERYKDRPNVIWVLGGDRPLTTSAHFAVIQGMAAGLTEGDGGRHLKTFHPTGGFSSSHHVHDEDWLDFNMIQSGHGQPLTENYRMVSADYGKVPVKPTLDAEPCYEDHPIGFNAKNGYFDSADVRRAAYWSVLAGSLGHTYGHHCIWSFNRKPEPYFIMRWQEALRRPGAEQMKHLRALSESRPHRSRVPDTALLAENYEGANHLQACRGNDYAIIYTPNGLSIKVNLSSLPGQSVRAWWFDPRNGAATEIGVFANTGVREFVPPSCGRGGDWVLVLDDVSASYHPPGQ